MNAKRLGFIIVAILLMGLSYWAMSMVNDDVKSVKVDSRTAYINGYIK